MAKDSRDLRCLWAKLPRDRQIQSYHPLQCHLLDVAMVTRVMWTDVLSRWTRQRVSTALGLDEEAAGRWITFFSGAHDIGKACAAFAVRAETPSILTERMHRIGLFTPKGFNRVNHGAVSTYTLRDLLGAEYGMPSNVSSYVADAVGGHHGTFPAIDDLEELSDVSDIHGGPSWRAARVQILRELACLVDLPRDRVPQTITAATAMWLAGFVSVADWIGSNDKDFFRYAVPDTAHPPDIDLVAYRDEALATAYRALRQLGWLGSTSPSSVWSFGDLFPHIDEQAPVQRGIVELAQNNAEPALVIVEAPMGEGKTEAALYLADHWDAALGQHGFYVALPSQATSNQMFGRVKEFLQHRYAHANGPHADQSAVLQLLHGHAALSAEFEALLRAGAKAFSPRRIYDDAPDPAERPDVVAGEWFTYKKRGLLSPFGVGTVDQSLLAVLGTRHVFVRLFGLAGKTVIVDEVHAYDTYMTELLERLLCWLGALHCSVVLLSATLPSARRHALLRAYRQGAGETAITDEQPDTSMDGQNHHTGYPRITWAPAAVGRPILERHIDTSERSRKVMHIESVDGRVPDTKDAPFTLGENLRTALAEGGCAAVVCNTVRRARQVYRALQLYFPGRASDGQPELTLLHARYPFMERDRREKEVLVRFGKQGGVVETADGPKTVRRPTRAIVVTTQIIEQSLDLDFDLMVTDLAPVDLILQRTGRLWRHDRRLDDNSVDRPTSLEAPTLWLCQPGTKDGRPDFGASAYVYDAHVLLRSWHVLQPIIARGQLRIPDEVEDLIEQVYDESDIDCPADVAAEWGAYWQETRRKQHKTATDDEYEAVKRYIEPPDYDYGNGTLGEILGEAREEDSPERHPDLRALTRLTGSSVSIVLLHTVNGQLCIDSEGRHPVDVDRRPTIDEAIALLKQSLNLSGFGIVQRLLDSCPVPHSWQESALMRHYHAIELDATSRARVGEVVLRLDPDEGVIVEDKSKAIEIDEEAS